MAGILDARAILFGRDLPVEVDRHLLELADHVLEALHLAGFFLDLEALRPERGFP